MTTTGQLFYDPFPRPLSSTGTPLPLGYYNFYLSGSTVPAPVYQDALLATPYPTLTLPPGGAGGGANYYVVQADVTGTMQPIFMDPTKIYRVQLYNQFNQLIEDQDPYVPALPGFGSGPITLNAQGEVTIAPPNAGGSGNTLTVIPRASGTALRLVGLAAGTPILTLNQTVASGGNTASFVAANKPGGAGTSPAKWLPIVADGTTYYLPLWT